MPRHGKHTGMARRRRHVWSLAAVLLVGGLVAAVLTPSVLPGRFDPVRARLPWAQAPACSEVPDTVVELVVPPVIEPAVAQAVADAEGRRLPGGSCLRVQLRAQESADTVAGSAVLPAANAPQVWISDSSLWPAQVRSWPLDPAGSFGSTPVVLATSAATVSAFGWTAPPSWLTALDGRGPVAAPDLSRNAAALLAMQSVWQVAGRGTQAEPRLAAALLAAGRTPVATEPELLRAAARGGTGLPLVTTTEQAVLAVNQDSASPNLVAVYPAEGSPTLDFPILRVAPDLQDAAHRAGTDALLGVLTGPRARLAARGAGLRDPAGADPPAGVSTPSVRLLTPPPAAERSEFLARLAAIARPTRILTVVDVSLSMRTAVPGTGLTRLQLAGRAATTAGDLLTDSSSAGLWIFARDLEGDRPYRAIEPMAPLGSPDGAGTHRQAIIGELLTLDRQVSAGGTGLYRTALDAVRSLRAGYDPRTRNTVVIFTDGANEDDDGLTLPALVQTLRAETVAEPNRPVRLVCIGLGPTADLEVLSAMATPTGGAAYLAESPAQLQQVLYDAVARLS